jgi:nucleotide-binding universal stress UspA family protein
MWDRLLLAMDRSESDQSALALAVGLAAPSRASVIVLHVRERSRCLRIPPLESMDQARHLVDDAVGTLLAGGTDALGVVLSADRQDVARSIVSEAAARSCAAIVLGSTRQRGLRRLNGSGIRERVIRQSSLPVLLAPPALHCRTRLPDATAPDPEPIGHV